MVEPAQMLLDLAPLKGIDLYLNILTHSLSSREQETWARMTHPEDRRKVSGTLTLDTTIGKCAETGYHPLCAFSFLGYTSVLPRSIEGFAQGVHESIDQNKVMLAEEKSSLIEDFYEPGFADSFAQVLGYAQRLKEVTINAEMSKDEQEMAELIIRINSYALNISPRLSGYVSPMIVGCMNGLPSRQNHEENLKRMLQFLTKRITNSGGAPLGVCLYIAGHAGELPRLLSTVAKEYADEHRIHYFSPALMSKPSRYQEGNVLIAGSMIGIKEMSSEQL